MVQNDQFYSEVKMLCSQNDVVFTKTHLPDGLRSMILMMVGRRLPNMSFFSCRNTQTPLDLFSLCLSELEEPDHDDEPVGGAVLVRLQAAVGPQGVRGRRHASRAFRSHLAARYRALQQVSAVYFRECNIFRSF